MINLICSACPDIPSVTSLNPKHSITDQRWGLGLELHTTIITIYTSSYTSNATGSKPGCYKYIYTPDNEKIQAEVGFKYFEASKLSSCFLRSTYRFPCIQEYLEKEKGGEMHRLERDVTLDITVKVIPCLSMFPISIVTF